MKWLLSDKIIAQDKKQLKQGNVWYIVSVIPTLFEFSYIFMSLMVTNIFYSNHT